MARRGALIGQDLPGAAKVVRPDNGTVANAIGAALAQAGGEADRIVNADGGRKRAVDAVVVGSKVLVVLLISAVTESASLLSTSSARRESIFTPTSIY